MGKAVVAVEDEDVVADVDEAKVKARAKEKVLATTVEVST